MNGYQVLGLLLLVLFYGAYMTKVFLQKRKGIRTNQLGRAEKKAEANPDASPQANPDTKYWGKTKHTLWVEYTTSLANDLMILALAASVILNWGSWVPLWVRISGFFLAGSGCAFFITAIIGLRDSWRAGIPEQDSTVFISQGIYGVSRNPAFVGFDLLYIGFCLAFFNPVLAVIAILGIGSLHLQILEEEKFLKQRFGVEYLQYCSRVGRYLKGFGRKGVRS